MRIKTIQIRELGWQENLNPYRCFSCNSRDSEYHVTAVSRHEEKRSTKKTVTFDLFLCRECVLFQDVNRTVIMYHLGLGSLGGKGVEDGPKVALAR